MVDLFSSNWRLPETWRGQDVAGTATAIGYAIDLNEHRLWVWGENRPEGPKAPVGTVWTGFAMAHPEFFTMSVQKVWAPSTGAVTSLGALVEEIDGSLWGTGIFGGDGGTKKRIPELDGLKSVEQVRSGYAALLENGNVLTFGLDYRGHCGRGEGSIGGTVNEWTLILTNIEELYFADTPRAISFDGTLYLWGDNSDCQAGRTPAGTHSPEPLAVMFNVDAVDHSTASGRRNILIISGGKSYCIGYFTSMFFGFNYVDFRRAVPEELKEPVTDPAGTMYTFESMSECDTFFWDNFTDGGIWGGGTSDIFENGDKVYVNNVHPSFDGHVVMRLVSYSGVVMGYPRYVHWTVETKPVTGMTDMINGGSSGNQLYLGQDGAYRTWSITGGSMYTYLEAVWGVTKTETDAIGMYGRPGWFLGDNDTWKTVTGTTVGSTPGLTRWGYTTGGTTNTPYLVGTKLHRLNNGEYGGDHDVEDFQRTSEVVMVDTSGRLWTSARRANASNLSAHTSSITHVFRRVRFDGYPCTFSGYVREEGTGTPLGEAEVSFVEGDTLLDSTVTDEDGFYSRTVFSSGSDPITVVAHTSRYIPSKSNEIVFTPYSEVEVDTLYLKLVSLEIYTPEDLFNIRYYAREFPEFKIMNDIDLTGFVIPEHHPKGSWEWTNYFDGFPPIRNYCSTGGSGLQVRLDGQGYTINGLRVKSFGVRRSRGGLGLFASLSQGEIKNLTLTNVDIGREFSGDRRVGGLIGKLFSSGHDVTEGVILENCHVTGNLYGEDNIGGLIGSANTHTRDSEGLGLYMIHCTFDGNIVGESNVGGILGKLNFMMAGGSIYSCSSSGTVRGENGIGGLIGVCGDGRNHSFTIGRCFSTSDVVGSKSSIGGLIGNLREQTQVFECYSTGTVENTGEHQRVRAANTGGLFGRIEKRNRVDDGTYPWVINCYSRSHIIVNSDVFDCVGISAGGDGGVHVGGVVGRVTWEPTPKIINCYHVGKIDLGDNTKVVGGLVGSIVEGIDQQEVVINSYYDREVCGNTDDTGKGEPRITEQMTYPPDNTTTYSGWDFENVWVHDERYTINDGYPIFYWQEVTTPSEDVDIDVTSPLQLSVLGCRVGVQDRVRRSCIPRVVLTRLEERCMCVSGDNGNLSMKIDKDRSFIPD